MSQNGQTHFAASFLNFIWSCSNHLQKSIAKSVTWSFLMIRSVSFTSATFEAFAEAYLCFLVPALAKNAEVIKFLGILKNYVTENEIYFCSRKKSNVSLNKKVLFVFHTIFKHDFIMQIIYCIIRWCICSHFILFLFSYMSL